MSWPAPVTSGPDDGASGSTAAFELGERFRGISPSRILLGLDFDGTLAPIVSEPADAFPDPEAVRLLERLSGCLLRIVIVSGRDTELLAARLPVDRVTIIGNHGLEERDGDTSRVIAEARPYVAAIRRAADAVDRLEAVRQPGVSIERKHVTVTVHFRNAAKPQAAETAIGVGLREIAGREGLVLRPGRLAWELRPPLPLDKGEALRRLALRIHPEGVIYAGDDITDADAFRALVSMRPEIATLAIGVRSAEVSERAFAATDLLVDGVGGVKRVLRELQTLCDEDSAATSR